MKATKTLRCGCLRPLDYARMCSGCNLCDTHCRCPNKGKIVPYQRPKSTPVPSRIVAEEFDTVILTDLGVGSQATDAPRTDLQARHGRLGLVMALGGIMAISGSPMVFNDRQKRRDKE
jgi:hypothetical protein